MTASTLTDGRDPTVRPQDDLFGHVNGAWLATATIPPDRATHGSLDMLRDGAEEKVRALVERAAEQSQQPDCDPVVQRVGDLYRAMTDTDTVEKLGVEPLTPLLQRVDEITTAAELLRAAGELARVGVPGPFDDSVWVDRGDPTRYLLHLSQGGLGLPDESYYRLDEHSELRADYATHVDQLLELVGAATAGAGERVLALETALAASHWDRTACRDAVATYNRLDHHELIELVPDIDAWFDGAQVPAAGRVQVVVGQPEALAGVGALLASAELADWKVWLRFHTARAAAPYLPQLVVDEWFAFAGTRLTGVTELRARWKRALAVLDAAVGQDVGRLFVEAHFPPAAQQKMDELVANLLTAYQQRISTLEWMTPQTRERALAKLATFTPKIGRPATFPDTSGIVVRAHDLLGSVQRATAHEHDRQLAKLGGPIDRDEWHMTPQTVNAYYNPSMNEIVFPAAILQEPFFTVGADDAENYGAIGAVIGHEIGHGFDDQGSRYDGRGALADWWTETDRAQFDERAQALVAQFDGLPPRDLPDGRVNGGLTVGENIGDLGGVDIAHHAYRLSLGDEADQVGMVLDGMTGDQRLFAAWARTWRGLVRPEEAARRLAVDPHSPPDLRAHVVRNIDAFHTAYATTEGDGMWLDPAQRVRIW